MNALTRADVDRIVTDARKAGITPNLGGADFRYADLRYADLGGADLRGADFRYATGAVGVALGVSGLPSGIATLYPTRDGWLLTVGCWQGTPTSLVEMIAGDTGWPEAVGVECDYRRPSLTALLVLCGDHMRRHEGVVADLAARWPAEDAS